MALSLAEWLAFLLQEQAQTGVQECIFTSKLEVQTASEGFPQLSWVHSDPTQSASGWKFA